MEALQFPIGRFQAPVQPDLDEIKGWIEDIRALPKDLRTELSKAAADKIDLPYRPGGWTVRQVVHHLADSHMNSFVRFKLALTEELPTIKPYREESWAELPDTLQAPVELSLGLLDQLHARWTLLLESLTPEELSRAFLHPDSGTVTLAQAIGTYAWHGRHHLAHIRLVTQTQGKQG
ncbi:YfiT family bacillithiol transferase [Paenibacillus filicis]|uniref:Putative metal-dependent hydrolase WMW72_30505 n=1 Tax=Paenibacillus filicis TaxID=669464 RepID=A0ABU9DU59_9BACL